MTSGSGVAFTRNPANGTNEFYGEFLINAQGEDVVAGVRTPEPVLEIKTQMPKSYAELLEVRKTLEKHFKDVQDIEFTIQDGKLFMLQTRNGKRTATAALKFSMDMVKEKLIDAETAVLRNPADQLDQLLAPVFDLGRSQEGESHRHRFARRPRRGHRQNLFQRRPRRDAAEKGEKVLLVRVETSPGRFARHDRGGRHSHRARRCQFARGARRPADGQSLRLRRGALQVDYDKKTVTVAGQTFKEGDFLSIDGTAGTVYAGQIKTAPSEIIAGLIGGDKAAQATEKFKSFTQLMKWCSQFTRLQVRTNADTPEQTQQRRRVRRDGHRSDAHGAHVL